jgi:tetratricopeptide (TPR) repeat protein
MGKTVHDVEEILLKVDRSIKSGKDIDTSIELLEETLEEIEPTRGDYYETLIKLATVYRYSRSYTDAENVLLKGIPNAKTFEMDLHLADIYRNLSLIKLQQKNYIKARSYAKKALSIVKYRKGFKADRAKANIYAVLGNIYFTTKEYDDALEVYTKALETAKKIDYEERVITLQGDIANVYIETDKLEKAEEILLSMKQKAQEVHEKAVPQIYLRLARIEYERGNLDESESLVEKAIRIAEKKSWKRDLAEAREALARVYKKDGKESNAKEEFEKANKIFKEIGLESKIKEL